MNAIETTSYDEGSGRPIYRVAIAIAAVLLLAATVFVQHGLLPAFLMTAGPHAAGEAIAAATAPSVALPGAPTRGAKRDDRPTVSFDVIRIDPGASVFAGRAPPNSEVTILANGKVLAVVKADPSGAWVAVTEREFAPADYEFSLRARSADQADVTIGQQVRLQVAASARSTPSAAWHPAPPPAPITFVYNDTAFTRAGEKSAALLAAYLNAQPSGVVALSGHADERGSDEFNMDLSRQRLKVVERYLRDHGFAGKLELVAKGKREPYAGADRDALSREDAFQLDRRVELHLAR
jgi:outer membrane protein OmpA-like peptidoglycan-associated protein